MFDIDSTQLWEFIASSSNFVFTRTFCLTKNYYSKECLVADRTVHTVCCKNLLQVDKRKVKEGGKVKVEMANQNLEDWQSHCQNLVPDEQIHTVLNEIVSKVKKVKVKRDKKKEGRISEVD